LKVFGARKIDFRCVRKSTSGAHTIASKIFSRQNTTLKSKIIFQQASKRECDKVIDKNGPAPKGTGIKQLRENIAESKLSYEIMDDAAQAFLKTKIMDNIQKYFYLICFTGYLRDQSKVAAAGITDEDKKAFALAGGKGTSL
jgi:hypothetical protein